MKKIAIAGILTGLVACSGNPSPKAPGNADDPCLAAGHNLAEHESETSLPDSPERARLDARLAAACRDSAWSAELISCMTTETELEDYGRCRAMMSEEQVDDLEGAWRDPEADGTEPPGVAAVACAEAQRVAAEILAASGPLTVDAAIWTSEPATIEADFAAAVDAIESCKPGAFAFRAGALPKVTWTDREEAAFNKNSPSDYSDAPTDDDPTVKLWLVALESGEWIMLNLTAQRVQ